MRVWFIAGAAVLAACSTKTVAVGPTVAAGSTAATTVAASFLQAVADSNLAQMGQLWGTDEGAAAVVGKPVDWLKRVAVIHSYLRGGTAKVVGENAGYTSRSRRQLVVELTRGGCVKSVPFTMIRTKQGDWLVNQIDLNAAGVPGRSCDGVPGT